ncbi:MAG: nucleotidyltransferase [Bacteroidetes bacterium]|nr:nucleotidyltransferase [Bacteroidota bacterium]
MNSNARNIEGDFLDFVQICNKHSVKYLVVGGFAVSVHGYPRYTKDLDICIQMTLENAEKLLRVIDEFGFGSLNLTKDDFMSPNFITQLGYEPLRIDILNDIDGVSFDEAWENRKIVNYENVEVPFIGYNELLKVKLKAGRPQDIADVEKLKSRKRKNS